MSGPSPALQGLLRIVLEQEGKLPLERLVQELLPIGTLRDLARKHGLSPKGYRIEKAPAPRLAKLLIDVRNPTLVTEVLELVLALRGAGEATDKSGTDRVEELEALLKLREGDLRAARLDVDKLRGQAAQHREREADLSARLGQAEQRAIAARAEAEQLRRQQGAVPSGQAAPGREEARRIHDLEREVETLALAEEGHRRHAAERQARIRELEGQVADLETRVPKGRKPPKDKVEAPLLADTFRLPRFTAAFYKSIEGKERRHVEQAFQAALLFCTEGPSYPGLEVKQIEGQELWSLRASLKLRVYFELLEERCVEFVAVADREDQHTTLRRLKER
ncbi:MAG: hypothetical protein ACO3RU_00750 [Planctomycetota bacterium]|jgi:hypothetical protein